MLMEKKLVFSNNGVLSLIDMTTMGDSVKRTDNSKTGQFDSGLKYAIAILLRHNVEFHILSGSRKYTFSECEIGDEQTGKSKNVIKIDWLCYDSGKKNSEITGFAVNLGYDWEFWMAIRELYSNCLDENGVMSENEDLEFDTKVVISVNDKIQYVLDNFDSYFFRGDYLYETEKVSIALNTLPGQPYTIYKNGIQIYSDPERQSKYVYECKLAKLDEMRVIRDRSLLEIQISYAIRECNDVSFITNFLQDYDHKLHDSRLCGYGHFSDEWVALTNHMYTSEILPNLATTMFNDIIGDKRFRVGKRKLSDSDHWMADKVTIEIPVPDLSIPIELTLEATVLQLAKQNNIEVRFPVFEASIKSSTQVIADLDDQCLYVNGTFSNDDVWELVKEIYRLEKKESSQIWKDYVVLLNK